VRRATGIALVIGLAGLAAAVAYAGAGAVVRALGSLGPGGLLLLILAHLPVLALMGLAWWLAAGDDPPATRMRFLWARLVRDAAAETLPFLQFGGVLLGVRALGQGRAVAVLGAAAACIDGLIELGAKLPYVLAALAALLALAPHSRLERPLLLALLATAAMVAIPLLVRRSLGGLLTRAVSVLGRRLPAMLSLDEGGIRVEIRASFERILRPRGRLWWAFILHLLSWFLGAAEAWLTFRLLGQEVTWLQALALDGAVVGLRTFGLMVPAAAGVQEASYLVAAAVLGISPPAAVAAALARRGRDLLLGIATLSSAAAFDARIVALPRSTAATGVPPVEGGGARGPCGRWHPPFLPMRENGAVARLLMRGLAGRASKGRAGCSRAPGDDHEV
jgi:putative membrane protein